MKPIRCWVATLTVVMAGSALDVQAAPEQIPFNPPVVHRGYNRNSPLWKPQQRNAKHQSRSLLFEDADRRSFKAMHPFLLEDPQHSRAPFDTAKRRATKRESIAQIALMRPEVVECGSKYFDAAAMLNL